MHVTDAQSFLDENFAPWVLALSPEVVALTDASVTLRIPITPEIARVGGIVSGQAMATLADTAQVLACCAAIGRVETVGTVTLDMQFLRPAVGESITCEATVVRLGGSLAFTRAVLVAEPSGKEVATSTATFARPKG